MSDAIRQVMPSCFCPMSFNVIIKEIDYDLWLLDDDSSEDIESIYNKYQNLGLKFFKNKANSGLTSLWNKGFELNKDKDYLIIFNNDLSRVASCFIINT